ncbi:hypothetical protein F511_08369 [Dorcoceras hygrometricum]|uniref:Fringe-related family protein n=1 Tax=Dorcoceras hygrometricum TaxID=472368 RepID=A0A2Z7D9K8_9LAMI|nr:hypothetical protein F511_08369 [Dorcoceras hygrometricum]
MVLSAAFILYFIATFSLTLKHFISPPYQYILSPLKSTVSPTNLSHLVFGIIGSEKAWHHRKAYIESWWKTNVTRGFLFLDKKPKAALLPWPETSPPFRVSENLTRFLNRSGVRAQRMVHGIMEVFNEDHEDLRWLIMGDDDSIFFVDNIVDVVAGYDHRKYYYLGGHSETVVSNYLFSFNQAFGGAGIVLSYPLAKALANDMKNCLRRYAFLNSADNTTRACISDLGVNLSPHMGNHQAIIDLHGDISGLLSSHPVSPLLSLHHFDMVDPIFPSMNRFESARHLMKAANMDQSRMLQQTICYHRRTNWSVSVSWGYSAQIYERIMPRSYLQIPIATFQPWIPSPKPPNFMFNTRQPSRDPCEAPHVFSFKSVENNGDAIVTRYTQARRRALPACVSSGNHSADFLSSIRVLSPAKKRIEVL